MLNTCLLFTIVILVCTLLLLWLTHTKCWFWLSRFRASCELIHGQHKQSKMVYWLLEIGNKFPYLVGDTYRWRASYYLDKNIWFGWLLFRTAVRIGWNTVTINLTNFTAISHSCRLLHSKVYHTHRILYQAILGLVRWELERPIWL